MTLDQYKTIRDLPEIPMEAFFDYYKERGGTLTDFSKFNEILTTFMWNDSIVTGSGGIPKKVTHHSVLNNFYNYYNQKFGL